MFHTLDTHATVFETVTRQRVKSPYASEVVMKHLLDSHEFGSAFFRKVLQKSVLKPGSIEPRR